MFPALAQTQVGQSPPPAPIPRDVIDFWVNRVGLPADMVIGAGKRSGASTTIGFRNQPEESSFHAAYGREPLFLCVDDLENRIVPAEELPSQKLLPAGDAQVELTLQRFRLNPDDEDRLQKYKSGGVYLDLEQRPTAAETASALAWSTFGAIFPKARAQMHNAAPTSAAPTVSSSKPGVESIALPGGTARVLFSCFLKDPRRTAFGNFVNTFLDLTGPSHPEILPLLSLATIAAPALLVVRALVANLQAHGGNHGWLFQNTPLDVVACAAEPGSSCVPEFVPVHQAAQRELSGYSQGARNGAKKQHDQREGRGWIPRPQRSLFAGHL